MVIYKFFLDKILLLTEDQIWFRLRRRLYGAGIGL